MKPSIVYTFFACLLTSVLGAQPGVVFTGRILDENTGRGIAGITVRLIGQGEDITDDQGIFRISVQPNIEQVQLELPSGWVIQYPRNGQAPVPRSANARLDVEVKQLRSQNERLLLEIGRLQREQKLKEVQIDSLQQVLEDSLALYQKRFQVRSYEYEDAARRSEAETRALEEKLAALTARLEAQFMEKNKTEIRGTVSAELLAFLDRLKDLRDFLPNFRDVFLYPQAADNFDRIVESYNQVRTPIYDHHQDRLGQVRLYWQDAVLSDDLEEVYRLILDNIHQRTILPMNGDLIQYRKDWATGRMPRVKASKKAQQRAQEIHQALAFPIQELEQKIKEVNSRLTN